MARSKITRGKIDEITETLKALPEKDRAAQEISAKEGLNALRPQLLAARGRGYTMADIASTLRQNGFTVSVSALKRALQPGAAKRPRQSKVPATHSEPHA